MSKVSISTETFTCQFSKVDKRHVTVYHTLELIDDDTCLTSNRQEFFIEPAVIIIEK